MYGIICRFFRMAIASAESMNILHTSQFDGFLFGATHKSFRRHYWQLEVVHNYHVHTQSGIINWWILLLEFMKADNQTVQVTLLHLICIQQCMKVSRNYLVNSPSNHHFYHYGGLTYLR